MWLLCVGWIEIEDALLRTDSLSAAVPVVEDCLGGSVVGDDLSPPHPEAPVEVMQRSGERASSAEVVAAYSWSHLRPGLPAIRLKVVVKIFSCKCSAKSDLEAVFTLLKILFKGGIIKEVQISVVGRQAS